MQVQESGQQVAEQRLHSALAPVDILTRLEMEQVLHKGMENFFHQEYLGVSYKEFNGNADGATSVQIPGPDSGYAWALKLLSATLTGGATPAPSQPAVPASTVAQQNVNSYPVQVVISGGTATSTSVNGIVVGAGDGTFVVPAYGSISVTYSVAPTWVWSAATGSTLAPTVAAFMGENSTTAPIGSGAGILAGGIYSAIVTFTSNVVVMSDQRVITLVADSSSAIAAYKLTAKQVPAEMVGKL
jgi:hypothetical protein